MAETSHPTNIETNGSTKPPVSFDDVQVAFRHKSDKDLKFSLFIFRTMAKPGLVKMLTGLTRFALALHLPIGWAIKRTIFRQFCGGETINECAPSIDELGQSGVGSILDYSVEGEEAASDLDHVRDEILRVIDYAKSNPNIPVTVVKVTGICSNALLEKVSNGTALNAREANDLDAARARLNALCKKCHANDLPLYIDAEESWLQPAIDRLAEEMMHAYNQKRAIVFNTAQLYRHDRLAYLKAVHERCREAGVVLGVKLVRGAYLEKENSRAEERGYPTPIQPNKEATDRDFNAALTYCIEHLGEIEVCSGTHNEQSCALLTQLLAQKGVDRNHPAVYCSQLYGMSDHLSFILANEGYNVSKYLPYGPVRATVPYLMRRAEENTAIAGQMGKELRLLSAEAQRREALSK